MKKLNLWFLGSLLLSVATYAQVKPLLLGTASDVLASFRQQATARCQAGAGSLMLRINATQSLPAKINYRSSATGNESFIGEIENIPGSSFFIHIEGATLRGNIILRKNKKAYKYYSDKKGNVYITKTDIHKVLCIDYNKVPTTAGTERIAAASNTANSFSL